MLIDFLVALLGVTVSVRWNYKWSLRCAAWLDMFIINYKLAGAASTCLCCFDKISVARMEFSAACCSSVWPSFSKP